MIKNYFTLDEDFETIIKNALPNKSITSIRSVTTGWTNIVFEVSTTNGAFFFRFPRDDFWSRTIVKDYEFCKFIDGKTTFRTVKLNLLYDNGRPFSMHQKIEGTVLADKINVILDDDCHISAIIDFGFAGFGNKYFDIARIFSRDCPKPIQDAIIKNYEIFSNETIDTSILKDETTCWVNIDNAYINYMRGIGIYE